MALVPMKRAFEEDAPKAKDVPPSQGADDEQAEQQPDAEQPEGEGAPGAPSGQQQAAPADQSGDTPTGGQATPAEQKAYDTFVTAAGVLLYQDDASHARIMKALQLQKDDPAPAIAEIATSITVEVDKQSGNNTPERVIIPAAVEIASHVAELGQTAGYFTADDKLMGQVGQQLLVKIGDAYNITREDIQQFLDQFTPQQKEQARAQQAQIAAPAGQPPPPPPQQQAPAPPPGASA